MTAQEFLTALTEKKTRSTDMGEGEREQVHNLTDRRGD